ncbi:fasciclin domain-containing protein [Croceitalea vernalis]|uniref:Fasciclin domain-containing protein n=1 Tax=Croceitalea vernalis TaxID=3075599 RepID=A0ABU3BK81_9FLAO|nr:fasciclin domain-containing protein [Croceitalea sp. P007]MDT0622539.1 fasciclin domain-containing protein [Croceitalea sp. P007]
MKHFLQLKNFLLLIAMTLFVLSCNKDDDQNVLENQTSSTNIVETAQGTDDLSSLVAALIKADENENSDLVGTLSGEGPFTVFAPTNEAFTELLSGLDGFDSLSDFDTEEEKALLADILKYHVVVGAAVASDDLSDGQEITTVQSEKVTVSLDGGVFINDSEVIIPDVATSNGIVHVINKVLVPQAVLDALNAQDLVDVVIATETLSSLEAAVIKAGLVDTLKSEGPFTVFAPTDDAFMGLLMALGSDYSSLEDFDTDEEIALLRDILLYHVVPAQVLEADLAAGTVGTALAENSIEVIAEAETFVIGDASEVNANIALTDVIATNGVAHVIDKVLLPQSAIDFVATLEMKNIVELAIATDDLSLLVDALAAANAGLVETLSGEGPFTVFAPTNDAFVALLDVLGEDYTSLADFDTQEELDLLVKILTYHVIAGTEAFSTDLSDGQQIGTVNGANVTVSLDGGVFIDDASESTAQVIIPDVDASNGVVHVINKVLLPQEALDFVAELNMMNIVETAIATDDLSLLVDALIAANAGLVETLSSEGPFTVFAPTNDAFVSLLDVLGDDYNSLADFDTQEELDLLIKILTYHVVAGTKAFSTDLSDGQQIGTVNGANVSISLDGGVFIGDASEAPAQVVIPDVDASNGVVHVINKVLLPQEAIDFVTELNMMNIVETAIATDDLSLLVDALVAANAGLVETLSGDGPFTVFAPTNEAFISLLDVLGDDYNSLADFDTDEELDLLVKILTYHVVAGTEAFSTDLSDGQSIETVNGASVRINLKDGTVHVVDATDNNATVVIPDVDASNGVVHVINKVLLPQEALDFVAALNMMNIVETAIATDDLSLLVDALIAANAGLVETLSSDGPFTVFAPTNEAFAGLLDILGDEFNSLSDFDTQAEIDILIQVLTYHVVAGTEAFSTDLSDGQTIQTVQGENITINLNGGVFVKDATDSDALVIIPDVAASNGVVHVINKVLLPQEVLDILFPSTPNIVELAQSVDDLSILVDALIQADAGLVEALSGEGPFTVFAPTNKAFANLLDSLGDSFNSLEDFDTDFEKELLAKILTYHVVNGVAVASTDLSDHQEIQTLQGESVFAILNHGVAIRDKTHIDANVTGADNLASNGIVHIIDKVLLPQEVIDVLH